jgi:hypothetical protein
VYVYRCREKFKKGMKGWRGDGDGDGDKKNNIFV